MGCNCRRAGPQHGKFCYFRYIRDNDFSLGRRLNTLIFRQWQLTNSTRRHCGVSAILAPSTISQVPANLFQLSFERVTVTGCCHEEQVLDWFTRAHGGPIKRYLGDSIVTCFDKWNMTTSLLFARVWAARYKARGMLSVVIFTVPLYVMMHTHGIVMRKLSIRPSNAL